MNYFLAIFATLRLTEILCFEKIFKPVREAVGFGYNEEGEIISYEDNFLVHLLLCPRCTSVWLAAFITFLYFVSPNKVFKAVVWTLSLSWFSYMIDKTDLNL